MARYQTFLSPEKNRDFFMSPAAWSFSNTFDDGLASTVAMSLYYLLLARESISSGDDAEDKVEVIKLFYSHKIMIFRHIQMTSLLHCGII